MAYSVGDKVSVLSAAWLPAEKIVATGVVERITHQSSDGTPLYWVSGQTCARTERVLRPAQQRPLTANERDGGASHEARQNAGIDY